MVKGSGWFCPERNNQEDSGSCSGGGSGNGGRRFFRVAQRPPCPPPMPCSEWHVYVEVKTIRQFAKAGLSTNDTSDWDEKKSIAKLRELLKDKRYLIIIDDVWSTQAWNAIKCAFPENNCTSRIIATTRIIDVGKSCCQSLEDRMYAMEALSDLHSRRLFFKRIFSSDDHCPDMLNEVSSEILKKCGGLPLAIISISSLLANRPAVKEEWEKVARLETRVETCSNFRRRKIRHLHFLVCTNSG
ncbi:hypothetical protein ACQ4PT_069119 [Festuca glaucescens]